jgi:hypothetical protein
VIVGRGICVTSKKTLNNVYKARQERVACYGEHDNGPCFRQEAGNFLANRLTAKQSSWTLLLGVSSLAIIVRFCTPRPQLFVGV